MRKAAILFALVWGVLMVQPLFAHFGGKPAYAACEPPKIEKPGSCSKKKSTKPSCKISCKKQDTPEEKKDCRPAGNCNPTLGCSLGNFFAHQYSQIQLLSFDPQRPKMALVNDNRVIRNGKECWHPPEQVS